MTKKKKKHLENVRISRECWNLDYSFCDWLNKHLKVFKRDASKLINLEFHKYEYKGKEITQLEVIDRLIELTDYYIYTEDYLTDLDIDVEKVDEMLDLFKLVFYDLWW